MKRYSLVCIFFLLAFFIVAPAVAQPSSRSVETILIDDFDEPDTKDFSWTIQASNSVYENEETGEKYPKLKYVAAIPNSLRLYRTPEDPEPQVLGVHIKFSRKGDNWFEIYPQKNGEDGEAQAYEIPFKGTVSHIDFWAWGANYLYYLDVLVRDADGRVHVIPATNMDYKGWRNIVVRVPSWIPQQSRLRSGPQTLTFVGFRVRTDPKEFVDDFMIYFDQLRYSSNTLFNIYDGFELKDFDFDAVEGGTN